MHRLFHNPMALLLIQAMVIIPLARILGTLFSKINQPMVIGEIIAGLLLGPSFLGWIAPELYHALFPEFSLHALNLLSQVGLIFFMFLVGLEFNPRLLRGQARAALATSHASIVFPFLLGTILALFLYPKLSDNSVRFAPFALFMGASMSVTAFPVLARILTERNLIKTRMGALALTCGAVDDITAWMILAFVISVVRATGAAQMLTVFAWTGLYLLIMVLMARPLLRRFERRYSTREGLSQNAVAGVMLMLLASALATELIGIHALFGAFFLGAIMPNETAFVRNLTEKIEDIVVLFMLPLFFAFTGLKTQIGLVDTPELWVITAIIMAIACVGKFGGSCLISKLAGCSWRESSAIGILMNTRGLMELIILNIGLNFGVISPLLFTMLVLMALLTTLITTPLLAWIYPDALIVADGAEIMSKAEKPYTVLVAISLPRSAQGLMTIAAAVMGKMTHTRIYALHLTHAGTRPSSYVKRGESLSEIDPILPLIEHAKAKGQEIRPLTFYTHDPSEDIVDVAKTKRADLILLGWHKPIFGGRVLGGTVRQVLNAATCDVGVFIDRGMNDVRRILVPIVKCFHDRAAIQLAKQIAAHFTAQVTLFHVLPAGLAPVAKAVPVGGGPETSTEDQTFFDPDTHGEVVLMTRQHDSPADVVLEEATKGYDLIVIGVSEEFALEPRLFGWRSEKLAEQSPTSLLIVRRAPQTKA